MKRRHTAILLSFLLLCILCLAAVPERARAAEPTKIIKLYEDVEVSTLEELRAACASDYVRISLQSDITAYADRFLVDITGDYVRLDLNGHQLWNTDPENQMAMGGCISVEGDTVVVCNGTIKTASKHAIGVWAAADTKNLWLGDIETAGPMGVFLYTMSDCAGVTLVEGCAIEIDPDSSVAAIRARGNQALILQGVLVVQGTDNTGSGGGPSVSVYPAFDIGADTNFTMNNTEVHKRCEGYIMTSYNTGATAYGYVTAPDAEVILDGQTVSLSTKFTTGTIDGKPIKEIYGTEFQARSPLYPITDVQCYIEPPVAGEEISYEPGIMSAGYYLAEHDIGNMHNDTSWQVKLDSGKWDMDAVNPGDRFEAGKTYRVLFDVTAEEGCFFPEGIPGYLNFELATDYWTGGSKKTFRIIQEFPEVEALHGWVKDEGLWRYYDDDGIFVIGWKKISGKWYYFDTDGYMLTGWQKISGKWYHFASGGAMQVGWQKISNVWYYFSSSGVMATGWKQISSVWYYFNSSGAMQTGWKTISGKTYYFKSSGAMAASEWCGGWWLNKDGTWTYKYKASWKKDSKGWYYQDTSGWYAKSTTIKIDDKMYTFNAKGYWVE